MKLSNYNIYHQTTDGNVIILNSLLGGLFLLKKNIVKF